MQSHRCRWLHLRWQALLFFGRRAFESYFKALCLAWPAHGGYRVVSSVALLHDSYMSWKDEMPGGGGFGKERRQSYSAALELLSK